MGTNSKITILHFNDVYNIEARKKEPVGGAARFATAIKQRKHLDPFLVFSGDAFSPSILSAVFKGKQMSAALNAVGVNLAVYGNHDFDFGVDKTVKLSQETKFPWLLGNVYDNLNSRPLAEGKPSCIIEWHGKKLGFLGLVEEDWIASLSVVDPDDVTYVDFIEEGRSLAQELREQGADYVIALTHMRWPEDRKLAEEVIEIDLILGGHDHDYNDLVINGKHVLKSGTDFRYVSQVTLTFEQDGKVAVDVEKITIDSSLKEDEGVKALVDEFAGNMEERLKKVLGCMEVDLDGRFSSVRTQETNLGNFIVDIMMSSINSDVALLNSGALRSDRIHPAGPFRLKDMMEILAFGGSVCMLELDGETLHKALEVGVSEYPAFEGRFNQVAGLTFTFDPRKPTGARIDPKDVIIDGNVLDLKQKYKVAVSDYIADGRDGYDLFENAKKLIDEEAGPTFHSIIQNYFKSVKVAKGEKQLKYGHKQALLAVSRMKTILQKRGALDTGSTSNSEQSEGAGDTEKDAPKPKSGQLAQNLGALKRAAFSHRKAVETIEKEQVSSCLAPKVEGRITIVS